MIQFITHQICQTRIPTRISYRGYGIIKRLGIDNLKIITQSPDQCIVMGIYNKVSEMVEL